MVMEIGSPHEPGRISVTLKSDGRDGTWIVFHGNAGEIRRQLIATFDIEDAEGAPLFDLINEATRIYKSTGNVSAGLGGRVVGKKSDGNAATGSAWDKVAEGEKPEPEVDPNIARLTAAIEAATTTDALRDLYARNAAHFANPDLLAAWQAKGKALS